MLTYREKFRTDDDKHHGRDLCVVPGVPEIRMELPDLLIVQRMKSYIKEKDEIETMYTKNIVPQSEFIGKCRTPAETLDINQRK